ncbi:MAG: response regulator, partial [Candidatus Eremiobacterota bacterium]
VVVLKMVGEIFANVLERKKTEEIIKKSKEAAEQANIAKSQFLATMSHEIRTPLNAIIGMTSLLMETTVTEEQKEFIETIRISSDNLLRIISDILDFSKIEAERFELEYQPFNLRTCIEEALNLIFPKNHPENIEILYVFHNDTPQCIRGDLTKVMQILVNLLSNAVKFTEKGDIILTVSSNHISEQDYKILFAVKDSGIGIAQDKLNLLFRPFSQVDNSTKRKYEGTGLGLAISKKLCEMMGGSMWLESEENKGTTFYFTIMARASYDIPWDFPHGNQQKLSGKRLLLVNNRELTKNSLKSYCTDWGMDVTSSSSAEEALSQIINEKNFDAVIIDIPLADMNNRKIVSEIHEYLSHRKVPLIMFSPMREQFKTTLPEIIPYLTKPFKPLELHSTLNKIFTDYAGMKSFLPEELQDAYEDKFIRILLAEDRVINQKVALRLLKYCGYVADIASNGLEVLDALKRQIYDVILMDVQMPEMDGLETTRIIRKEFPGERQPWIIAMTAGAFTHDRDECFMAGMNDYISKPIKLDKLKESLRKCKRLEIYETCLLTPIADIESKKINISFNHKEIFDRQELIKNLDDDEELFKELIDIFLDTIPSEIASLKAALNRKDFVMARRFAHSIKGVSGNIKANALSYIALNIEMAVKEDDIERASLLLPDIEEEFLKFKRLL